MKHFKLKNTKFKGRDIYSLLSDEAKKIILSRCKYKNLDNFRIKIENSNKGGYIHLKEYGNKPESFGILRMERHLPFGLGLSEQYLGMSDADIAHSISNDIIYNQPVEADKLF